jgi:hypothetical protein
MKLLLSFVVLEIACIVLVRSPLRDHVAAIAGQSATASGAPASPIFALVVVAAQMASVTILPVAIIGCILHTCMSPSKRPARL